MTTNTKPEENRALSQNPQPASNSSDASRTANDHSQEYDRISEEYDKIKVLPGTAPLVRLIDRLAPAVLDWTGVSVLDLACGTGFGLRKARQLGATRVVGIDINEEMLRVARVMSESNTELYVADCYRDLGHLPLEPGSFDVVTGFWLATCATTKQDVAGMWTNVSKYLRPGGKFIGSAGFVNSTTSDFAAKYGPKIDFIERTAVGEKISLEFQTEPIVQYDSYNVDREVLDSEAEAAGLSITYVQPSILDVDVTAEHDRDWWRDFLEDTACDMIVGTKRTA